MKKNFLFGLLTGLLFFGLVGSASATLVAIGTADYDSDGNGVSDIFDLNLIWDDDNNGNSVVWLDFTNGSQLYLAQMAWATGLDGFLSINLYDGYSINWNDVTWRLPDTVDGYYEAPQGHEGDPNWDGTTYGGYNITTSEMGHLFYDELGNKGYLATDGTINSPSEVGLTNTGNFENLYSEWYWSRTTDADEPGMAWVFTMAYGYQFIGTYGYSYDGLAIRSGDVSFEPVPEPATIMLFGTGIAGLAGIRLRKKSRK